MSQGLLYNHQHQWCAFNTGLPSLSDRHHRDVLVFLQRRDWQQLGTIVPWVATKKVRQKFWQEAMMVAVVAVAMDCMKRGGVRQTVPRHLTAVATVMLTRDVACMTMTDTDCPMCPDREQGAGRGVDGYRQAARQAHNGGYGRPWRTPCPTAIRCH